jgi:hypothetical protein
MLNFDFSHFLANFKKNSTHAKEDYSTMAQAEGLLYEIFYLANRMITIFL